MSERQNYERPDGSNADEWHLFLDDHRDALPYVAVQVAEAIDAARLEGERGTCSRGDCSCVEECIVQAGHRATIARLTAERDANASHADRLQVECEKLRRERDEARQRTIREIFDWMMMTAANNYSVRPEVQSICDAENGILVDLAEDMLAANSPGMHATWKDLGETLARAEAAERERDALAARVERLEGALRETLAEAERLTRSHPWGLFLKPACADRARAALTPEPKEPSHG